MEKEVNRKGLNSLYQRIVYEKDFFDKRALEFLQRDNLRLKKDYAGALKFLGIDQKSLVGKRILDCGCGIGDLSVWLATKGASVCSIDVSPKSLDILKRRADLYNVNNRVEPKIMAIEDLQYGEDFFDLVVGEWILHHAIIERCIPEVYRVLKKGGRAIFLETSANNRILIFFRRFIIGRFGIPKYQDEIEHPLTYEDIKNIRKMFNGNCKCHYVPFVIF